MSALQAVRTALFYFLFIGQTVILALPVGLIGRIWGRTAIGWALAQYWASSSLALLRAVVGVDTRIEGLEHVPEGPFIIASKHQSDWDIFALFPLAQRPAFIAKRELIDIPFFGWAARSLDAISVDRRLGGMAIPRMLEDARRALARGCRIIIFPEGTRRAPLAPAKRVARLHARVRELVPRLERDRVLSNDIAALRAAIGNGAFDDITHFEGETTSSTAMFA